MLIKKLSRILAISALAFVAVLLWNTKSSQADESSKLLNNAAIQKIVKKGTLNVGVKQDVPNFGYYSAQILTTMTKSVSSFKPNLAIRNFLTLTVKLLECLKGHLPKPLLKSTLQLITLSSIMSNSDLILS